MMANLLKQADSVMENFAVKEANLKDGSKKQRKSLSTKNGNKRVKESNLLTEICVPPEILLPDAKTSSHSISYEDFLQQMLMDDTSTKNSMRKDNGLPKVDTVVDQTKRLPSLKKCGPSINQSLKSHGEPNSNLTGPAMSYSDFLNLFKPPPSKKCSNSSENDDVCVVEMNQDSIRAVKCKSIKSYFTKCETTFSKNKKSLMDSSTMTITAEVHNSKLSLAKNKCSSLLLSSKLKRGQHLIENPDDIVLISTETVDDLEAFSKPKDVATKKRKMEDVDQEEVKKKKTSTLGKVNKTIQEVNQSFSQDLNMLQSSPSVGLPKAIQEVSSSSKCTQSTLCFGRSGLSLSMAELKKADPVSHPLIQDAAGVNKHVKPELSQTHSLTDETDVIVLDAEEKGGKIHNKRMKLHVADSLDSTPITVLLNDSDDGIEIDKAVKEDASETPTLRRSSRLTRSVKPFNELVVDVDIESEEESSSPPKSKTNKTAAKKPIGKMAPIFTIVRSKDNDIKTKQPTEDPETLRLRREFLMSGIPDELKRQINSSTNSSIVSDYPPFPTISHVQQLTDFPWASKAISFIKTDVNDSSEALSVTLWNKLEWGGQVLNYNNEFDKLSTSFFETFSSHKLLSEQADVIFERFSSNNSNFLFKETYAGLQSKMACRDLIEPSCPVDLPVKESDEDIVIIVDDTPPPAKRNLVKSSCDAKDCLWTDLHHPASSDQLIGNTKVVKELKRWLEEWKDSMQKEARRANMVNKPKTKIKGITASAWSDDSDFTDSEDEDEFSLCNTMLISGPHGVGKTCVVYALAQELGYKVFEVNSSSLRSGKHLLAQLEEATQSHKVAQNKSKSAIQAPLDTSSEKKSSVKKDKDSITPTTSGFVNLFRTPATSKKISETTKHQTPRSKDGKKSSQKPTKVAEKNTKCSKLETAARLGILSDENSSGSLNLASVSLILFDEVDVFFEEDKGFLSTVQYFMTSTKIPIILTSADTNFHLQISSRHDHIMLQQPSLVPATSFLCTVCLAHGVVVDQSSISRAWNFMKGDIRRCLLYLQYWCESGGGRLQSHKSRDLMSTPLHSKNSKTDNTECLPGKSSEAVVKTSEDSNVINSDDGNDNDFICLRPPSKRPRRMVIDDGDNSIETVVTPTSKSKGRKSNLKRKNGLRNEVVKDNKEEVTLPMVHMECEETLLGLPIGVRVSSETVLKYLKSPSFSNTALDEANQVCLVLSQALHLNVTYHLALHNLSFPKTEAELAVLSLPWQPKLSLESKTSGKDSRNRIIQGDWFDSSGNEAGVPPTVDAEAELNSSQHLAPNPNQVNFGLSNTCNDKTTKSFSSEAATPATNKDMLNILILSEMARFYEATSYVDYLETVSLATSGSSECTAGVSPGMNDAEVNQTHSHLNSFQDWSSQLLGTVSLLASRRLGYKTDAYVLSSHQAKEQCNQSSESGSDCSSKGGMLPEGIEDVPEELHLPIGKHLPDLWDTDCSSPNRPLDKVKRSVLTSLGTTILDSDVTLHTDYLPALREICRLENGRHLAKTQRRFHHYLASIGMGLKESTLASLATEYAVKSEPL